MRTEIVTTLKREATRILSELRENREPVLITEHGKPSAYLVDAEDYELMQNRMYILEGIARGERAVLEKKIISNTNARKLMGKWLD